MRRTAIAALVLALLAGPARTDDTAERRAEDAAARAEAAAQRSEAAATRTETAVDRLERLVERLAPQAGNRRGGGPRARGGSGSVR